MRAVLAFTSQVGQTVSEQDRIGWQHLLAQALDHTAFAHIPVANNQDLDLPLQQNT